MTTYPTGGLLGVWVALENIDCRQWPITILSGQPQITIITMNSRSINNEGNNWLLGGKSYTEYEKMIEQKIKQHNISKKIFHAFKGDLLIWHANLFPEVSHT